MKIALVKLLKNFEILPSRETSDKLDFVEGTVRVPKDRKTNVILKRKNFIDLKFNNFYKKLIVD